ncbi:Transcription initiation factor IIA subunit 2 [Mycena indigotica]|uniref:Transcription initiation factor IIA subunit 2 n=1 Tax=Mycena indigotica TaxID=2126181 RepID=A0A8H6RYR3_9AGAR|nr:Transcription initiation factor IIA subunit 2 [Mycena indigotica]KAF7289789.1 Transcription initiation factor IIA subunit 2 [Mycena indigotica]
MATAYYEFYRGSSLGMALTDSLDELITSGAITPQLAMKVLQQFSLLLALQFDKSLADTMVKSVKAKTTLKVHIFPSETPSNLFFFLASHFADLFISGSLENMESNEVVQTPRIKIIACKNGEAIEAGKK